MVLARWGRYAEAEALAHEAIGIAAPTHYCECLAEGFLSLGEVLGLSERRPEAVNAIEAAHVYDAKGFKLSSGAASARLQELNAPRPHASIALVIGHADRRRVRLCRF
jgi:hypothetical protein